MTFYGTLDDAEVTKGIFNPNAPSLRIFIAEDLRHTDASACCVKELSGSEASGIMVNH
jgi:hypothetical protein